MAAPKSAYDLAYGQYPLPTERLPTTFSPGEIADIVSTEEIRQRLAYYLFCIDGMTPEHLDKVFVKDAIAYYSEHLGYLAGLKNIQKVLKHATANAKFQHLQSTQ